MIGPDEGMKAAANRRWRRPGPTTAAIVTCCVLIALMAGLFFATAFLTAPRYEWGPTHETAYGVAFAAMGCCLIALIAIIMATIGVWPRTLYPLAAVALVQAAVLSALSRQAWAAIPLLALAAATPWWSVERPRAIVAIGLAFATLLISAWGYQSMAKGVARSSQQLVCLDVSPSMVASLESLLTATGVTLDRVQAVRSRTNPLLWFVAAQVEGDTYGSAFDTAAFVIDETGTPNPGALDPADSVYANNGLASEISDLEYNWAFEEAFGAAQDCARPFQ